MAEEPCGPSEKNSSASSTSLRCRCRISVASRSTDEATTPSVAKYMACRSRGMTCVETGSTANPIALATCSSTRGSTCAKVPTAPEMAQGATSVRELGSGTDEALLGAKEFGVRVGELDAEGRGFGVDAVGAPDGRRVLVLEGAALERR